MAAPPVPRDYCPWRAPVGHSAARAGAAAARRTVTYESGGRTMAAEVVVPPGQGRVPAVMIAHTAIGPQEDFIRDKAADVVERLGCVAFALDLFGAGKCVFGEEKDRYNDELRGEGRKVLVARARAARDALCTLDEVDPERLAIVGFCLGGKAAVDVVRARVPGVKCAVSIHGVLDAPDALPVADPPSSARILCLHGAADPFVPDVAAFEQDMKRRGLSYELVAFDNCVHAFTRPDKTSESDREAGLFFDGDAAETSYEKTMALLEECLR